MKAPLKAKGTAGGTRDRVGTAGSTEPSVAATGHRWWAFLSCFALAALFLSLVGVVDAQNRSEDAAVATGRQAGIRILESDEHHVLLEVSLEGYSLDEQSYDGLTYSAVSIPAWGQSELAGAPQLPVRRVLLGIPYGVDLHLTVTRIASPQFDGPLRLRPAPEIVAVPAVDGTDLEQGHPAGIETRLVESVEIYGQDTAYPAQLAKIVEVGNIRDQRVAAIEITPVQYLPSGQQIAFHSHFLVELGFSGSREVVMDEGDLGVGTTESEHLLFGPVENWSSARSWRQGLGAQAVDVGWVPAPGALKILVAREGFYRVTPDSLRAAGVNVDHLDPRTFQVFSGGTELAVRVHGESDGHFGSGDYVLFFGEAIRDKYTAYNVYWLVHSQQQGLRMETRSAEPAGLLEPSAVFTAELSMEEDIVYSSLWPGGDSVDRWFQPAIASLASPAYIEFEVDLGHVASEPATATLWVSMKGHNEWPESDPDHRATFFVNDQPVGAYSWNGLSTVQQARVDFDQALLSQGLNRFRTTFLGVSGAVPPRDVSFVLVDRYWLQYGHAFTADAGYLAYTQAATGTWEWAVAGFSQPSAEVYDVSEPTRVVQLSGVAVDPDAGEFQIRFEDTITRATDYVALTPERWLLPESITLDSPSSLHDEGNGADYVIITHGDFVAAARNLASYRSGQGLRTMVVDIADVYDEFGYGLEVPGAIREFLRYAVYSWQPPAPLYVVLLGDGTFDPKNHLDLGVLSFIPPYLRFIDPWMGEAAADNWYVTVVGEDIWPDLYLGRMPANSLAEAHAMVDKTIDYEQSMEGADWTGNLTFVAGRQPDPKNAGSFHDLSDLLVSGFVPSMYSAAKIYLGDIAGSTCTSPEGCKQQLVEQINEGTLLVTYVGHGSVVQWHRELWGGAWQSILDLPALDQLTNTDRFPVMLPMTCLEGNFTNPYPQSPAISESLVRAAGKGAVASWGPTGLGVANGHDELSRGFLTSLLLQGNRELGAATYAGKLRLYQAGHSLEQIEEYTVFGDPALRINTLGADLSVGLSVDAPQEVFPGDALTFTLAFHNAGPGLAHNVVLSDRLQTVLVSPTIVHSDPEILSQSGGITFTWTLTGLQPGSGGVVRFRATVAPTATLPTAFFNRAEIASATYDPQPGNNLASVGIGTSRVYLPLVMRSTTRP